MKTMSFLVVALTLTWGIAFQSTSDAIVPGVNEFITVNDSGNQANGASDARPSVSGDGNVVAFASAATNLVAGDTNGQYDIFVRNRTNNTTERVSVSSAGVETNQPSSWPSVSYDGRFVAFQSDASNLVSGDTNSVSDVFISDVQNGTTTLVSKNSSGTIGDRGSGDVDISADGRFVVFTSYATNLVTGVNPLGIGEQVFMKDLLTNEIQVISKNSSGTIGNQSANRPKISCDGGVVAFASTATNLVSGDTNGHSDIFLSELGWSKNNITNITMASRSLDSTFPNISCNGNYVAFQSYNSTDEADEILTYNRLTKQIDTIVASEQYRNSEYPDISDDGRFVVFNSERRLDNSHPYRGGSTPNVFIYDRRDQSSQLINIDESSYASMGANSFPVISADGSYVVYIAAGDNSQYGGSGRDLVPGDSNGINDIYISKTGF